MHFSLRPRREPTSGDGPTDPSESRPSSLEAENVTLLYPAAEQQSSSTSTTRRLSSGSSSSTCLDSKQGAEEPEETPKTSYDAVFLLAEDCWRYLISWGGLDLGCCARLSHVLWILSKSQELVFSRKQRKALAEWGERALEMRLPGWRASPGRLSSPADLRLRADALGLRCELATPRTRITLKDETTPKEDVAGEPGSTTGGSSSSRSRASAVSPEISLSPCGSLHQEQNGPKDGSGSSHGSDQQRAPQDEIVPRPLPRVRVSFADEELPRPPTPDHAGPLVLVLENLRNSSNIGMIYRTAAAYGVKELWIVNPKVDRYRTDGRSLRNTSKGFVDVVRTKTFPSVGAVVEALGGDRGGGRSPRRELWVTRCLPPAWEGSACSTEGGAPFAAQRRSFATVAPLELAPDRRSSSPAELLPRPFPPPAPKRPPVALVLGAENTGTSCEMIQAADRLVHLQMAGKVESFNVAACAAILLEKLQPAGLCVWTDRGPSPVSEVLE